MSEIYQAFPIKTGVKIRVWAHNAHKYDLVFLFPILKRAFGDTFSFIGHPGDI